MKRNTRLWSSLLVVALLLSVCVTPSAQAADSGDGYIYYENSYSQAILRVKEDFTGTEELYRAKTGEFIRYVAYYKNKVYFLSEGSPAGVGVDFEFNRVKCLDLNSRTVTTVLTDVQGWNLIQGKLYFWKDTPGETDIPGNSTKSDLWMSNVDGSGAKKTSLVGRSDIRGTLAVAGGKIYMTSLNGNSTGQFYSINLDGTGFAPKFTVTRNYVASYELIVGQGNYLYFRADSYLTRDGSQGGIYRINTDGSNLTWIDALSTYELTASGDYLYYHEYTKGFVRTDLAGKNPVKMPFQDFYMSELAALPSGHLFFYAKQGACIVSIDPNNKTLYEVSKFSPHDPMTSMPSGDNLLSPPKKLTYFVGEGFDPSGLVLVNINGVATQTQGPDRLKFHTSGVALTPGSVFTTPGTKKVSVQQSKSENMQFTIEVLAKSEPSNTKLTVDGTPVAVEAYAIDGNNYIKLRDMAYILNGTSKNFNVTWDGAKNAINLMSKTPYLTVAGDMSPGDGTAKAATASTAAIYIDGVAVPLKAYTIGQSNYIKLRDVMEAFDVAVGWDAASGTASLDTTR